MVSFVPGLIVDYCLQPVKCVRWEVCFDFVLLVPMVSLFLVVKDYWLLGGLTVVAVVPQDLGFVASVACFAPYYLGKK